MTTIAIASDIHQEFDGEFCSDVGDCDIIVMAGDVHSRAAGWSNVVGRLRKVSSAPIIAVMGNHEYYGGWFPDAIREYKVAARSFKDVYMLDRETVLLDGVTFIGCTMWSDMCEMRDAEKCRRGIADFRCIRNSVTGAYITPENILKEFNESVTWLRSMRADRSVVVTHHAPSFMSSHPQYALSPIKGAFCSNLENLVMEMGPELWVHGHVHDPAEYHIGKTRVVCNPWGYPREMNRKYWKMVTL